ncbi:hypothetical protein AVEN_133805-1 [Araneus ventricosus]|uniref:Uncharacterized protein n=1 Tax=Araneus ventricosus TaxID=182803 RepID=A0A4Y2K210_ARAVE|nr:hypothetical protein AVEN_133805-1 [Araneus ventricosus]
MAAPALVGGIGKLGFFNTVPTHTTYQKIGTTLINVTIRVFLLQFDWTRCDFQIFDTDILEDFPEKYISVREAVANESKFGGQESANAQCQTKMCLCKKQIKWVH